MLWPSAADGRDPAFVDRFLQGDGAGTMPDWAKGQENFKDYSMGVSDGVPKIPDWASEICGLPAADIIKLAGMHATTRPGALKASSWRRRIGAPYAGKLPNFQGFTGATSTAS